MARARKERTRKKMTLTLSPRAAITQNVRRRLAHGFQIRPTEDQMTSMEKIRQEVALADPRVTQADMVRGAIDFFIDAWQRERGAKTD